MIIYEMIRVFIFIKGLFKSYLFLIFRNFNYLFFMCKWILEICICYGCIWKIERVV